MNSVILIVVVVAGILVILVQLRSIGTKIFESLSLLQADQKKFVEILLGYRKKTGDDAIIAVSEEKTIVNYFDPAKNESDKKIYYKDIDFGNSNTLFNQLNGLLTNTHIARLPYNPSLHLYPLTDNYEDGQLRSIYSGKAFTLSQLLEMDAKVDEEIAADMVRLTLSNPTLDELDQKAAEIKKRPYNCEHVVPQAWFNHLEPMKGDLHHLFTCEVKCNEFRSNYPYTDFADYGTNYTNEIKDECGKLENKLFEPEINKGIVARAVLYFLIRYPSAFLPGQGYTTKDIPLLIKWHSADPVTKYELHRNQIIYQKQGNRNPFIDFPELSSKIKYENQD